MQPAFKFLQNYHSDVLQHRRILFHSEPISRSRFLRKKSRSFAFIRFGWRRIRVRSRYHQWKDEANGYARGAGTVRNTMLLLLEASIHLHASRGTCLDTRFIINAAAFSAARSADRFGFVTTVDSIVAETKEQRTCAITFDLFK